jgi:signal transduction histidine kinase
MDNKVDIILIVMVGSLVIFILVMMIIVFTLTYNRKIIEKDNSLRMTIKNQELELLRNSITTQEDEREIIARNLHDEVGPLLTTLKLNINNIIFDLEDGKLTVDQLKTEQKFVDRIIENIRTASYDLTPHFLLKFGLEKTLRNFFNKISSVDINFNPNFVSENLSKPIAINVYRLVLELTNNIVKHENVNSINVNLYEDNNCLNLKIVHHGKGLTQEEFQELAIQSKGLGLNSVQARVVVLDGKLTFDKGTAESTITLTVPL